jgi:hypothetical protein
LVSFDSMTMTELTRWTRMTRHGLRPVRSNLQSTRNRATDPAGSDLASQRRKDEEYVRGLTPHCMHCRFIYPDIASCGKQANVSDNVESMDDRKTMTDGASSAMKERRMLLLM